jgi:hypothetical protein
MYVLCIISFDVEERETDVKIGDKVWRRREI